jgi:5'(3')-deoxyribonucleotidase
LRIAVDLDGVLAETMEAWCKHANDLLGTSFKLADLDTWASWRKLGISREQFFQFLNEAWDDWKNIPPTEPRLAEKVQKLAPWGQIDVVTGRSKESVNAAKSWLALHKISYQLFVRVPGWKDKIFLDYDVYVDDAPELMPLISRNPSMWGILYTRPWNMDVPDIPRVFRAQSWTEIPKLVKKLCSSISPV